MADSFCTKAWLMGRCIIYHFHVRIESDVDVSGLHGNHLERIWSLKKFRYELIDCVGVVAWIRGQTASFVRFTAINN